MAENFVNILREIRGKTLAPATDRNCIYGDIKWMYGVIKGYQQITPEERSKLENIEEGATKNSTDAFLLSRANHTGNISMSNVTDSNSRFAMTINDKNKLDLVIEGATKNDTDANLRNRATHTGSQSIDTISNSFTHVKMTVQERDKLENIQSNSTKNATNEELRNRETHTGSQSIDTVDDSYTHVKMKIAERDKLENIEDDATKNATNEELRNRSTHTGTQSADTIVDGFHNAAFTNAEKVKLAVLDITKPPAHLHDNETINSLSYGKLINVPISFNPSEHLHHMDEVTLGNLDASRINESSSQQFVSSTEKDKISGSEQAANRGVPNGYAPLGPNGKINPSYIESLNLIDIFTPVDFEAMLLLGSAKPGDIAYDQESQNTYMLIGLPSDNPLNWKIINLAAGVVSINGLVGAVSMSSDDLPEGTANKYFTEDRVTDRVKDFIKAGTNVAVSYDSITNELTISANNDSIEWSEIQNKPSPNISVEITGDASGSANTTLTELASGSIEINNLTLSDTGTAGTYRKITTDSKGRVISGEGATTIAEYEITDAYTKTEIDGFINNIDEGISDLVDEVALKAYADNATLTGVPTAPTAAVGDETTQIATTAFVVAEIADKAYSKTQLDAGQLDNRYYTEIEIDNKLAEQNNASEISYDGTVSELVATNVQDAIDEVEGRLDVVEGVIAETNLTRADKYLASKDKANLIYSAGNLVKIRYTTDNDVDYEVLTYAGEDLTNVAHYVDGVLQGNTVLTYSDGNLVSSIFVGV